MAEQKIDGVAANHDGPYLGTGPGPDWRTVFRVYIGQDQCADIEASGLVAWIAGPGRALLAEHGVRFQTDYERRLEGLVTAVRAARDNITMDRDHALSVINLVCDALGVTPNDVSDAAKRSALELAEAKAKIDHLEACNARQGETIARLQEQEDAHALDTDLAKQLNCPATAPAIIDAVTRLQEANARLTSEQAGPLAVMRRQADEAKANLASLVQDVRAAIEEGCGGPWRPDDKRTDRASLLEAVHELGAALRASRRDAAELRAEMLRDADPVAVHEAAQHLAGGGGKDEHEPDDVCDDCGEATCELCDGCHDCEGECQRPTDVEPAPRVAGGGAPGLASALESAHTVLVTDPRDWLRADRPMSWLYGLLVGFSVDVLPDVARRHGWDAGVVERLLFMHDAVAEAMTPAGEE